MVRQLSEEVNTLEEEVDICKGRNIHIGHHRLL